MLGPSIRKTNHRVEHDIPNDILLDSYPGPLGQILTNLINNAIIHGLDGHERGTVHIAANHSPKQNEVEVTVCDDGNGIAPEVIPRIFDPFFTTKQGAGGSGLGLSIARNIATKILGGRIEVSNSLGKGTKFAVTIPLSAPQQDLTADKK